MTALNDHNLGKKPKSSADILRSRLDELNHELKKLDRSELDLAEARPMTKEEVIIQSLFDYKSWLAESIEQHKQGIEAHRDEMERDKAKMERVDEALKALVN